MSIHVFSVVSSARRFRSNSFERLSKLFSSSCSACLISSCLDFLSVLLRATMLTSGLSDGVSAVRSTSMIFESFAFGLSPYGLVISVDASNFNMFSGVTLSVRSDPAKSQKDISFIGSARDDVDCPLSFRLLGVTFRHSACGISESELSQSSPVAPFCTVPVLW